MENILEKVRGILQPVSDFMQGDLKVMNFDLKIWMLFAAGGAIILITLVLILLLSGRKRKAKKQKNSFSALESLHTVGEPEEASDQPESEQKEILSIGDGDTVDLEAAAPSIVQGLDPVTSDQPIDQPQVRTTFSILARMRYRDLGQEGKATVMEGSDVVIGRGEGSDVQIQTNPSDTAVSHQHGVIFVQNDLPYYRDESRNGTMVNRSKTLHRGEMMELPVETPCSIQVGNHQIILFLKKLS